MVTNNRRQLLLGGAAFGTAAYAGFDIRAFAQASKANTLRIALSKQTGNLDPRRYVAVWAVQSMIYDPLLRYGKGGKLEPALAESWTVSEDGKVLTFNLRKGVTFTDGTPWNSETMRWNLEQWIGREDHSWLLISDNYDRVEIKDEYTTAIHLKQPVPSALVELTTVRPVRFISPASVGSDGVFKQPIGTGPWKVEVNNAERTELVRNDKYWGATPKVERVSMVVIPNSRSRISALRAGEIDITGGVFVAAISPQEASTLQAAGVNVVKETGTDTMVLGFNPQRPILQDPLVREAMSLCIDRDAICEKLMRGYATPTANLFPDIIPDSGKRLPVPKRDIARAQAILEQAGWTGSGVRSKDGKPLEFEMVISEDAVAGSRALGEVLQSAMKDAGIQLKLRLVDHVSRHDDIPQLKYDLALFITAGAPYDPHSSLTTYFLSTYRTGTDGKMFMDAAALDPLVNQALSADDANRATAYQRFYDWLMEHHAIAPIYHASRIWAHSARVKDFSVPPTEYEMPFEGISLAQG